MSNILSKTLVDLSIRLVERLKEDVVVKDEMASCLLFAMGAFKDKSIIDNATNTMTTWHNWFEQVLQRAGYAKAVKEFQQGVRGSKHGTNKRRK